MIKSTTALVPIAPDGGWSWMVVAGSFLAFFIADGWSYSFGVFYPELLGFFQEGHGKTALIGALLYGTPMVISPIVCALTTVYGCRLIAIVGGIITGLSLVLSAYASSVNFLCFSTGMLASVGLGFTYIPAIFIVTFHFEKKRGFATGLAVTGSGLGAFAFPPLMEFLLEEYAWRGMLLIFGGIFFHVIAAGGLFWPVPLGHPCSDDVECVSERQPASMSHIKCTTSNVLMPRLHSKEMWKHISSSVLMLEKTSPEKHISSFDLNQISRPSPLDAEDNQQQLLANKGGAATWASSPDLYLGQELAPIQGEEVSAIQEQVPATEIVKPKCGQKFLNELQVLMKSLLDKTLLQNYVYLLLVAHGFIMFLWIGVPYVYLVSYALEANISSSKASFLLSYIAVGRTVGMISLGWIGDRDRVNTILLYAVCTVGCGVGTLCVPFCTSYTSLAVYCFAFGLCVSASYVLTMMVLVEIVGLEKSAGAFGIFQLVQGIATLLGTPVAGWLYDQTQTYGPSFYTAGSWLIFSGLMLIPAPFVLRRSSSSLH